MTSLLIVYHSQSGSCAALARAAAEGAAAEAEVRVRLRRACDAGVEEVAAAGGLLLVAAENSGALSGGAKEFLDRVFYPAIDRELVLPYALIVSAGNDGRGAVQQAERIFRGIPFKVANPPQIFRGEPGDRELAAAGDIGQALAAGLGMGIF
ncbi:flavodoxin [Seongchinamella unica]|uniref:Flavodoxin n=1 Tax=Seongchinamella unica TaxID=2547392 RepID=A0A4R5LS14_9GAMM|nr:NAD(P)H-dependent oxidoreductase [Seongchinamella unica]TDG13695.1 flavodoxin [Seongchinamella unica]